MNKQPPLAQRAKPPGGPPDFNINIKKGAASPNPSEGPAANAAPCDNAVRRLLVDRLNVKIYKTRREMGACCGAAVGERVRRLLAGRDEINMIFAAAPSQNEVIEALNGEGGIDWGRVNAFHMDEYIALGAGAPQGFGNFLRERLFSRLPFKDVYYLNGGAADIEAECERYSLLLKRDIHIVCLGVGENGHIAFNDPGSADFSDPKSVKKVRLDEKCRLQQVHDGCFASLGEVPQSALTLTIPALMRGEHLFCAVPGAAKASAVRGMLRGGISSACPASILRSHESAAMFCDLESGKYIL